MKYIFCICMVSPFLYPETTLALTKAQLDAACNNWLGRVGNSEVTYTYPDLWGKTMTKTVTLSAEGCTTDLSQAVFRVSRTSPHFEGKMVYTIEFTKSADENWVLVPASIDASNCFDKAFFGYIHLYAENGWAITEHIKDLFTASCRIICPIQIKAVSDAVIRILSQ